MSFAFSAARESVKDDLGRWACFASRDARLMTGRQSMDAERKRVLTGDRPTGRMHLGHYVGSLAQRLRLQESHDCFIIVADLHSRSRDL
jgi:tyrosyl-tRNA synthetase